MSAIRDNQNCYHVYNEPIVQKVLDKYGTRQDHIPPIIKEICRQWTDPVASPIPIDLTEV